MHSLEIRALARHPLAFLFAFGVASLPVACSSGSSPSEGTSSSASATTRGVRGDINGDGLADIALVGGYDSGSPWTDLPVSLTSTTGVFFDLAYPIGGASDGDGGTGPSFEAYAAMRGAHAVAGDFNADGFADIALVGGSFAPGVPWTTLPIAFSNGNGRYHVTNAPIRDFATYAAQGAQVVAGDFNGDGVDDLALAGGAGWNTVPVATSRRDGTFIVTNSPNFSFASLATQSSSYGPPTLLAGDVDHDGYDDLILVGGGTSSGGSFTPWTSAPVAFSNHDSTFTTRESVLFKYADGSAALFGQWATQPGARAVTGDFDGDGYADIALAGGNGWRTVPVAFSNHDGTWRVTNNYGGDFAAFAQQGSPALVAGDFNGDRVSDLALVGGSWSGGAWNTTPIAYATAGGNFRVTNPDNSPFAQRGFQEIGTLPRPQVVGASVASTRCRSGSCLANAPSPLADAPSSAALLIVAPRAFAATLAPLVQHKNAIGISTFVATMEDVQSMNDGHDDAYRIKSMIAYARANLGTHYVMLAGDATLIPARHYTVRIDDGTSAQQFSPEVYFPTDFYYANLLRSDSPGGPRTAFSDWDADGDGRFDAAYGPTPTPAHDAYLVNPDKVDAYADVAVGRVPAHTTSEMSTYVSNVIRYESTRPPTAAAAKYTFFGDGEYPGSLNMSESVIASIRAPAANVRRVGVWFADWTWLNRTPGIPAGLWQRGADGAAGVQPSFTDSQWISYVGHGGEDGWGQTLEFRGSEVPTQNTVLPILFASGCETAEFKASVLQNNYFGVDGKHHTISWDSNTRTAWDSAQGAAVPYPVVYVQPALYDDPAAYVKGMGWSATIRSGGGAIAYIGSTQTTQDDKPTRLQRNMMAAHAAGATTLGDAFVVGQRGYRSELLTDGSYFASPRLFLNYMELFGDPSLRIQ